MIIILLLVIRWLGRDPDKSTPEYIIGHNDCINGNENKLKGQTFELADNAKSLYWRGWKQAERELRAQKDFEESEEFRKQLGIK